MDSDIESYARQALELSRDSILVNLRFMGTSFSNLEFISRPGSELSTDGRSVFYDAERVVASYRVEPAELARDYFHLVLHCVFQHPFVGREVDQALWDLACDIAVEACIADIGLATTAARRSERQERTIRELAETLPLLSAETVYRHLIDEGIDGEDAERLREPFFADDHAGWYDFSAGRIGNSPTAAAKDSGRDASGKQHKPDGADGTNMDAPPSDERSGTKSSRGAQADDGSPKQAPENAKQVQGKRYADAVTLDRTRETWKNAALEMGVELDSFVRLWGTEGSRLSMALRAVNRERHDYAEFLRKFAVFGEQVKIDDDAFDYVYYCYGLDLFGTVPLIEPLEYVDEKRIKDFVIAIDTSSSTKDELVHRFMDKTYSILHNETSFFDAMNVHIVQCDAAITEAVRVTSRDEFDRYLEHMEVKGLGGTDFRPVFEYVDALLADHAVEQLGGLIYFTDGYGTYPETRPDYECAFVFVDDGATDVDVPPWAIKILLGPEEL